MNKIVITGRLVRDPEMKTLSTGQEKCRFTVAVDRRVQKDKPKKTDFFDCDAWANTGAFVNKWFKKGSAITVIGRLESSKSSKEEDKHTYWTLNVDEVEFQMGKGERSDSAPAPEVDPETGYEKVDTDSLPF